jgi:MFS transporter, MHS family, shikimate and dehydroshikimate transport protein
VFNKLFFPEAEPSSGTLLALATYGVGFAARPFGGIIFGHFGDRIGRKTMLVLSLLIMGVATFLIGLMPTYDAIGIWAPILLVVQRIAQGIGVGGEWGGAVLMSVEHAPKGRRGFFGSWPQMGVPAGLFLSTVVFLIVQEVTSDEAFLSWGRRVPFLLSAVLIAVGLFVRLRLYESPAFQRVKDTGTEADPGRAAQVPARGAAGHGDARGRERHLLHPDGVRAGVRQRGAEAAQEHHAVGRGHRRLAGAGHHPLVRVAVGPGRPAAAVPRWALFSLVFAFPFFLLLNTKTALLIWLAIVLGVNVGHDLMYGPPGRVLRRAVRHQGPLQRGLARLPARLGVCRRVRPADRGRPAEVVGLAGRGRLHGPDGGDHGGGDLAGVRDLPERHLPRRPPRAGAGLGEGQPRSSCLRTLPRALRGKASVELRRVDPCRQVDLPV